MSELISVVVPMYSEEAVAEECCKRLTDICKANGLRYELVFVNDGSTDRTLEILESLAKKDSHVKVISFSRNFGHQIAVSAGIDRARGDAVIIMDADLQDPPELIPDMINLWKQGYEVVYAKRKCREGETWFKLMTAKIFYRVLNKLSDTVIPEDTGDFRLMDRKVVEVFRNMPEKNRFVRGMVSWLGFRQIPIEYERKERFAGETKYPLKKMIRFAMDGMFSFSSKPVKFVEYAGLSCILIAFCIFAYYLSSTLAGRYGLPTLWASVAAIVIFLGGIQLLSAGVLGEYISRISDESKRRPLYIIEREVNMDKGTINKGKKEDSPFKEGQSLVRIIEMPYSKV